MMMSMMMVGGHLGLGACRRRWQGQGVRRLALVGIGDKMTREWLEKAGPDGQAVLDAYRKSIRK